MKKLAILAAFLAIPALAEEPPKTYTLTEAQAADYARRLQVEMQQIAAQYKADEEALKALSAQQEKKPEPEAKK